MRNMLAAAVPALTLFAASAPARADETGIDPKFADLAPCRQACGPLDLSVLTLRIPATEPVAVHSFMQHVDEIYRNDSQNVIVIGQTKGNIIADIVSLVSGTRLQEFWTNALGVSPDSRYIAFTQFISAHDEDSLYSDALLYLYDATRQHPPAASAIMPPDAVPLFPESLATLGDTILQNQSPYALLHIITTDVKWTSPTSLRFYAKTLPRPRTPGSRLIVPVTVHIDPARLAAWLAGTSRLRPAEISIGTARTCDLRFLDSQTVDSLDKSCPAR